MTDDRMALIELIEQGADIDLVREMLARAEGGSQAYRPDGLEAQFGMWQAIAAAASAGIRPSCASTLASAASKCLRAPAATASSGGTPARIRMGNSITGPSVFPTVTNFGGYS